MTESPDFASVMATLRELPRPRLFELHCHRHAITWLRLTVPDAEPEPPWSGAIGSLTGAPVIEDPELGPGEWEIRQDGEVVASGRLELPWLEYFSKDIPIELHKAAPDVAWRYAVYGAVANRPLSFGGLLAGL